MANGAGFGASNKTERTMVKFVKANALQAELGSAWTKVQ